MHQLLSTPSLRLPQAEAQAPQRTAHRLRALHINEKYNNQNCTRKSHTSKPQGGTNGQLNQV